MITFTELKNIISDSYPVFLLEKFFPKKYRKPLRRVLILLIIFCLILVLQEPDDISIFRSLIYIFFGFWSFLFLCEFFYFSEISYKKKADFYVVDLVFSAKSEDVVQNFFESYVGGRVMKRCGIDEQYVKRFIQDRKRFLPDYRIEIDVDRDVGYVTLSKYFEAILDKDRDLENFLKENGVDKNTVLAAIDWVSENFETRHKRDKWWSEESLLRTKSLGRRWSVEKISELEKNGHYMTEDPSFEEISNIWKVYEKETIQLETGLLKNRESNIMLVGPSNKILIDTICALSKKVFLGEVPAKLESTQFFVIDTKKIIDDKKTKEDFEIEFLKVVSLASQFKNLILIIPNLPELIEYLAQKNIDFKHSIEKALSSQTIHVICLAERSGYFESIETNVYFNSFFEKVELDSVDEKKFLSFVQRTALFVEEKEKVLFTIQAILAITKNIFNLYLQDSNFINIEKALAEIAEKTKKAGKRVVHQTFD